MRSTHATSMSSQRGEELEEGRRTPQVEEKGEKNKQTNKESFKLQAKPREIIQGRGCRAHAQNAKTRRRGKDLEGWASSPKSRIGIRGRGNKQGKLQAYKQSQSAGLLFDNKRAQSGQWARTQGAKRHTEGEAGRKERETKHRFVSPPPPPPPSPPPFLPETQRTSC